MLAGKNEVRFPSISYALQTFSSLRPVRVSRWSSATESTEPILMLYAAATASNQPHRRGRPVVVPYSWPRSRMYRPISLSCSVGNGPAPTRVVYAFTTPMYLSTIRAGTPQPEGRPSELQLELVT